MCAELSVAVIGCGAMGGAIARGLVAAKNVEPSGLILVDASEEKAAALAEELGARAAKAGDAEALSATSLVILAVKPQVLPGVAEELSPALSGRLVVSIAAGVNLATLTTLMPDARVVRVMPNLALTAGSSGTAITGAKGASSDDVARVVRLFSAFGPASAMGEAQLDAMGAISGCEPAFVALFVDALTRAGIEQGLPAGLCREFILATLIGSAKILQEGEHPRAFMEKVMSPGGTTVRAVAAMDPAYMEATAKGIRAAVARTRELAEEGA